MNIEHIGSKDNALLKKIRKAALGKTEYFILENEKLIREAFYADMEAEVLAISFENQEKHKGLIYEGQAGSCRVITLGEKNFSSISSTVTNQGCLAMFRQKYTLKNELSLSGVFVVCDNIQDPGNMGAIVRSALGFGASGIFILPGTANPYNSKTIRASAGACLQVPLVKMDHDEFIGFIKENRVKAYALDAEGETSIDKAVFGKSCAIIVGNEGAGISTEIERNITDYLSIPIDERLESLNAAVSLSLVLYEIAVRNR